MFTIIRVPAIDQHNAMTAASNKDVTRDDMATFYADLILCAHQFGDHAIDFEAVHRAILERWPGGLNYIKSKAWKTTITTPMTTPS